MARATTEYRGLLTLLESRNARSVDALAALPLADETAAALRARDALSRR